jgi:hypothetical protein
MSTYVPSALRHRLSVPAWLHAVVIATAVAVALAAAALLDSSDQRLTPTAGAASSTGATPPQQHTVCVNNRLVGHC